jgi:translation elongation factor EF-1alpha
MFDVNNSDIKLYDVISTNKIIYNKFLINIYVTDSKTIITKGFSANLHINGHCVLFEVIDVYDISKKRITFCKNGQRSFISIITQQKVPVYVDANSETRIFIRSGSSTIAIGFLIKNFVFLK